MNSPVFVWLQFVVCMALIGIAGTRLIRYGDAIAALTGLSRSWVGLILVATVTSLPELVTGLSAVAVTNTPDIAVGDALGSCVFNLAILAFVDAFYRKAPVYLVASRGHVLSATFGVILLLTTALILTFSAQGGMPSLGHISLGSVVLVGLYAVAMRFIFLLERKQAAPASEDASPLSLRAALTGYVMASVVIVGSGIWLPFLGVELAETMGWSNSFVGTLFVAFATSVPELVTTVAALKIGAVDLAIGNLLGSNLFDVLILAIDDVAYQSGPLYGYVSEQHTVSAFTAAAMSGTVIVALTFRPATRILGFGSWASFALLGLYLLNAVVQFLHGR